MNKKMILAIWLLIFSSVLLAEQEKSLLIESGSANLFTTIYSNPEAETILLLHGGPGVPMDLSVVAERLAEKYQIIYFDQRGTGLSPVIDATYSMKEYISDIDAVANHFGVDSFHLFGHSWGGLYAQIYAENSPNRVKSLFLVSPSSGTGETWEKMEKEVMQFNKERSGLWGWSMMGMRSVFGMLGFDSSYQSLFKQVLENYNKEYDPSFVATEVMVENVRAEAINKTRENIVAYPELKINQSKISTLIAYGDNDIYGSTKERVLNRFPLAKQVSFKNTGHIPWLHNKEQFMETLTGFYDI